MPAPTPAKARVFHSGRSQHVTIPMAYRFRSAEVSIRRDPKSGDVILSEIPPLEEVFAALDAAGVPKGFLSESDRDRRAVESRPELEAIFATSGDGR